MVPREKDCKQHRGKEHREDLKQKKPEILRGTLVCRWIKYALEYFQVRIDKCFSDMGMAMAKNVLY